MVPADGGVPAGLEGGDLAAVVEQAVVLAAAVGHPVVLVGDELGIGGREEGGVGCDLITRCRPTG